MSFRGRPGRGGFEADEFDGAVQEQAAGGVVAAGEDLRPEVLGVAVVEQRPGHGGGTREPGPRLPRQVVARDRVLGDEPAELVMVDLADECPHGPVMARAAVRGQAGPARGVTSPDSGRAHLAALPRLKLWR
jgi:hypothetical protein